MSHEIRLVETYDEYKACEQLQSDVLGLSDLDVVPYPLLQSFAQAGGVVVGAFEGARMIGCAFGYTGLADDGTPYHRSQRLAVLPAYQGQGVGEALKRAQAEQAMKCGLRRMCWTFDPLRSRNAHLNLHKLGATSNVYVREAYAALSGARDAGVPIDRLWVDWALEPSAVSRQRSAVSNCHVAGVTVLGIADDKPCGVDLAAESPVVVIQIPDDIEVLRARDVGLVRAWRQATRQVFMHYFARGYRAVHFVRSHGYLLTRA